MRHRLRHGYFGFREFARRRDRIRERLYRWMARTASSRFKYFLVIQAAGDYSRRHPTVEVPTITWDAIARDLEKEMG